MRLAARAVAAIAILLPLSVSAQTGTPRARFEITGAAGLQTGADLGIRNGDLRQNSVTPESFTLFTTDSALSRSWLADLRLGYVVSPRVTVEGRLGYSRPLLETSVAADAEGASSIAIVERIDQYVIDAGIVIRLDEMRVGGLVPYAAGGAGYLRQLHEGLTAIEQGHVYHLGGGLQRDLLTRSRRVVRAAGLRVDARVQFLSGGIGLGDGVVTQGTLTGGVFFRF